MYGRLMLRKLSIEVRSESIAIRLSKGDRGCNIEVMEEVSDMQENRVTSLTAC